MAGTDPVAEAVVPAAPLAAAVIATTGEAALPAEVPGASAGAALLVAERDSGVAACPEHPHKRTTPSASVRMQLAYGGWPLPARAALRNLLVVIITHLCPGLSPRPALR